MSFFENPFYLLSATPMDSRFRLQQLTEDAQLMGAAEDAEAAYTALIKPESRLAAELRWLPGADEQTQAAFCAQLSQGDPLSLSGAAEPLARLNVLLFSLEARKSDKPADLCGDVQEICLLWGAQDPIALLDTLNAQRLPGGWKPVQAEQLRAALKNYVNEVAIRITALFQGGGKKRLYAYADQLLSMVRNYKRGWQEYAHNELIEELVSRFELETAALAAQEKESILQLTQTRHQPRKVKWSALSTDRMNFALKRWHRITHPIRLLALARGMRYQDASGDDAAMLASEMRDIMAEMFNRFRDVSQALSILYCLKKCFPELDELQNQLGEDEEVIKSVMRGKTQENPSKWDTVKRIAMIGLIITAAILSRCETKSPQKSDLPPPLPLTMQVDMTRHLPPANKP